MPSKALRPCKHPGCPELTRDPSGYCETHRAEARTYERYRGSATSRGYDRQWEAFRTQYLKRHPICEDCLRAKPAQYVTATEVHHVKKLRDYSQLKYAEDNLMALCHDCHSKRTARGE
ncbi:MAG: HNH endonuclease signature motif containing protein [Clostridiaceae bacterium]|nr:HNH endonuclease signature motif containing protein [Clostridiaceae bacterium]